MNNLSQATINAPSLVTYSGFIAVAPGKRYFQDELGQPFVVIGQNDAISWPGLETLLDNTSPQTTEDYIINLRQHGVTVSRIMIEYAQDTSTYFENPVGVFNERVVAFWDQFFKLAEKHGLYLLLTPYDTFWQVEKPETYPYDVQNGGPYSDRRSWLTDPAVIAAHKCRWDFIIQRWGGSPNILAWDVMNEIDNYWGCTPAEIGAYITEISTWVRALEQQYWGKTHMQTVSTVLDVPRGNLADVIYNHPMLDFANTHLYSGPGSDEPTDAISVVPEIVEAVRASLASMTAPRPYFDSESGPIKKWITDPELDRQYHHNLSWAHLATGGAGSGMRWPYVTPHCITPEMRQNLLGMAKFSSRVNWTTFASRNINDCMSMDIPGILFTGCADGEQGIVWLVQDSRLDAAPSLDCVTVTLNGVFGAGTYRIELWETYAGQRIGDLIVQSDSDTLQFTLPSSLPNDVALYIHYVRN